jgi:hypothetical protein
MTAVDIRTTHVAPTGVDHPAAAAHDLPAAARINHPTGTTRDDEPDAGRLDHLADPTRAAHSSDTTLARDRATARRLDRPAGTAHVDDFADAGRFHPFDQPAGPAYVGDLAASTRVEHLAIAARYAAAPEEWPVAPRFRASERWYHRLAVAPDHEVWLLTWLPGQHTDLHDHGGSAGAFLVHGGTLTEDTVTVGADGAPRITGRELGEGAGRRFGAQHIHRITNRSTTPAVSIHVYGPALQTMTRYRITDGGLNVLTVEKAGVQW